MALLLPSQSLVLNAYAVLVGQTPGNAALKEHQTYIASYGESGYKAALNSVFASYTTAQLATTLLTNLGLGSVFTQTDAEAYLTANAANRVGAMMDLANALYNYSGTVAGLVAAKTAYVNSIEGSYNYSIDTAHVAPATLSGSVAAGGQSFTLTIGVDNLVGTAGNDSISGVADGVTSTTVGAGQPVTQTFGGLDVLNGGDGTDTLTLSNDVGTMTLATSVTVSSIENLVLRSALDNVTADVQGWVGLESITVDQRGNSEGINIDTKSNVTSVTVTAGATVVAEGVAIDDNGSAATTADKLATVSVTGAQGAIGVGSDALANLTLVDSAQLATVTNTTVGHTLNVTANKQSGAAGVADAAAATINVTASGANSTAFAVTGNVATAINFAGDKNLVSTLGAQAANLKINSTGTGTLTINTTLDDDVTFTGGAGKETITISNGNTKAIAMGAGDDTVNVADALTALGTVDGGDGTDTLALSALNAATLSANNTYEKSISNFEKVSLGQVVTGGSNTINLANLDDISYVKSAGTAAANVVQPAVKEVQTITVGGSADADGGILTVGGVDIQIANGATAATVAAAIAAQETALKAANADIESVVQGAGADAGKVFVTYVDTAGDVGDITIAQQPSGVTLGNFQTLTTGSASSAEVQTITVGSAAAQTGSFTVGGVTVNVLVNDSANTVAAKITTALNGSLPAGVATVVNTGAPSGTVTITYNAAAGDVPNMAFSGADAIFGSANVPTIVETTAGGTGGTKEVQTFTVTGADADGGQLVIGGVKVAVAGGATADQVGAAIIAKQADILAANTNIESIGYNTVGSVVTVTYKVTAGNVGDLAISSNDTIGTTPVAAEATTGAVFNGTAGGALEVNHMANNGTFELTAANAGATSIVMTDATGAADVLNLKLNGAANLAAGSVTVAGVETIAITTTDSSKDGADATDGLLHNPLAASTLALNAAAATTITIAGNHGVDFSGSTLTKVTSLDASGVVANVDPTGLTAAQLAAANGTAGAVTFSTVVTDKDVTIKTGNGNDIINASSVGTAVDATKSATITTGAGEDYVIGGADNDTIDTGSENDWVQSSAGADTITLGAGNDTYWLTVNTDSVLAKYDTITDFSANTYGFGTSGAANSAGANQTDATKVTGDVIDLRGVIGGVAGIEVLVVTNAADAQTFIQNTADAAAGNTGIALDSSSNLLYIDLDSNGSIDSVIKLTGVTTITTAAFEI